MPVQLPNFEVTVIIPRLVKAKGGSRYVRVPEAPARGRGFAVVGHALSQRVRAGGPRSTKVPKALTTKPKNTQTATRLIEIFFALNRTAGLIYYSVWAYL